MIKKLSEFFSPPPPPPPPGHQGLATALAETIFHLSVGKQCMDIHSPWASRLGE